MERRYLLIFPLYLLLINHMCIQPNRSWDVDIGPYIGKWILTNSLYPEAERYYNSGYLYLYSDSTFSSNFSYYFNRDTLRGFEEISGDWYPKLDQNDRAIEHVVLYFTVDGNNKSWQIETNKSGNSITKMTWNRTWEGDGEYYWEKE